MGHQNETVVGVFLEESHAQRAVQALQSAGINARIADEGQVRQLSGTRVAEAVAGVYESRFREGNVIVFADAGGQADQAMDIMFEHGAENIDIKGGQTRGASYYQDIQNLDTQRRQYGRIDTQTGRGRTADEMRVQLREEELIPTKQAVQAGEVELRKTVHEEQREVPVNLQREQVTIERHAVDRPLGEGEFGDLRDETIDVPVYEERAELQKRGRVAEEVTIGKDVTQEQQTMRGTVRREDIDVDQQGNVRVQGTGQTDAQSTQDQV